MIEKGSMFKAWEATTEQQKKAHEMQAIYKAQETARQAIQEAMNQYIKKKTRARSVAKAEADPFAEVGGQRGRTAQGKERRQISRPCNRYAGPCYSQRGQ